MQSPTDEEDDFNSAQESDDDDFTTRASVPEAGRATYSRKVKLKFDMGNDKNDQLLETQKELERIKQLIASEQSSHSLTSEAAKRYRKERDEKQALVDKLAKEKADWEANYLELQKQTQSLQDQLKVKETHSDQAAGNVIDAHPSSSIPKVTTDNEPQAPSDEESQQERERQKLIQKSLSEIDDAEKQLRLRRGALLEGAHLYNQYKRNGAAPKGSMTFDLSVLNSGLPNQPSVLPINPNTSFHQSSIEQLAPATNSVAQNSALNNLHKTTGILNANSKEFQNWFRKLTSCLVINGLWFDLRIPFDTLSEAEQRKSILARHAIELCVDGLSQSEIKNYLNSIDALNALIRLHDATTATNRIAAQQRITNTLYSEGDDMVKHIAALREAYDDLGRYGSPATDRQQTDQLICSLPTSMNSVRNIYAAWPPSQYTFDNVAMNLREAYKRDQLAGSRHNTDLPTSKGYLTNKVDSRLQPIDDERSRISKFRYDDRNRSRDRQYDRSSSRNRYNKNRTHSRQHDERSQSRDNKNYNSSRKRSLSNQRGRSPIRHNNSPFRNEERSRDRSQDKRSNKTSSDDRTSSVAYHEHGGYIATVTEPPGDAACVAQNKVPALDDWKPVQLTPLNELRQRLQMKIQRFRPSKIAKRRDKRYLKRCEVREAIKLATEKKVMSTISRPQTSLVKSSSSGVTLPKPKPATTHEVNIEIKAVPPEKEKKPKILCNRTKAKEMKGEEYPDYASWCQPKTVRFEDVSKAERTSEKDKRELVTQKTNKRPMNYLETLKRTRVVVPVTEFNNLGYRQVSHLEPLTISLERKSAKARLNPPLPAALQKAPPGAGRPPLVIPDETLSLPTSKEKPETAESCTASAATHANAAMFSDLHSLMTPMAPHDETATTPTALMTRISDADVIDLNDTDLELELNALSYPQKPEIKNPEIYINAYHLIKNGNAKPGWIIDSGASVHMTYDESLFHDIIYDDFGNVSVADGYRNEAQGKGTVMLNADTKDGPIAIHLTDVLFVPTLNCNLISVKALNLGESPSTPPTILFQGDNVSLKTKCRTSIIGKWKNNAYMLNEFCHRAAPCVHEWHRRIAHRNLSDIKRAAGRLNIKISKCACSDDCDTCMRAKLPNKAFSHAAEKPKSRLDIVVSDLSGPYPPSHAGSRYYMTMHDLATNYTEIFCLRNKSDATQAVKDYIAKQENILKCLPKIIRTDRGLEYCNQELSDHLAKKGIIHQLTCAESPQQNGVAERLNRTLHDAIRAQLLAHSFCGALWSEALHHTVYTLNRLPRNGCDHSPIENFYGKKFEHQFYEFGHPCYVSVRKIKLTKLNERAKLMRFVGVDNVSKGFRVWDGHKVWVERNVRFMSSFGPSPQTYHNDSYKDLEIDTKTDVETERSSTEFAPRRSPRLFEKQTGSCLVVLTSGQEPSSYIEAITSEDSKHWEEAIKKELLNCKANKIWTKVAKPDKRKIVGCKWVFKIKRDETGKIDSYKARIVAKGFSQTEGIDYEETFAAVATSASLRLLLTKASKENLVVKQFDVTAAFLNGMLKEEIYMKPPPGLEEGDFVLKLEKSLYGLKQAAHVWYNTLSAALLNIGFRKSQTDPCLHIYQKNDETAFCISHVDDLLWVSKSRSLIDKLASRLGESFKLKDLGDVHHFLGLDIKKDSAGHYSMSQSNYIDKIAKTHSLENVKRQTIPLNSGYYKLNHEKTLPNNNEYRSLLGSLLYIAVNTRPDIAAAINILAQKTSSPSEADFTELKHVLAYLLNTKDLRLKLYNAEYADIPLIGYSDADWGEDKNTRKSVSGILCLVHGAPIIWASKKQHCVSLSSTEAEYYAVGDTIRNLVWLQNLLEDVGIKAKDPIILHCDNLSCVKLALKDNTKRSKHFDIKYHFVKDEVKKGKIAMTYVPTDENLADLLTKPLAKNRLDTMKTLYRLH